MRFGLALMNDFPPGTTPASRVGQLREQVRAASDAGLHSVWVLQHYLGNMPTLQPVPLLATLAPDAGDLFLGTNMFILPLRHPVAVAEEFATLDHLSGGRVIAGFGMGYRENEFASFGVPMAERASRFEEAVTIVRALWTGAPTTFRGEHFRIEGQSISLPPVQPGGPQVWIGAGPHRTGATRAARLGDAWIIPPHVTPGDLGTLLGYYRDERGRRGHQGADELVVRRELILDHDPARARADGPDKTNSYRHLESDQAAEATADQSYLFTDPAGAVQAFRELEAQGFTYVVLRMQWYDLAHERVLQTLEMFRKEVLPALTAAG